MLTRTMLSARFKKPLRGSVNNKAFRRVKVHYCMPATTAGESRELPGLRRKLVVDVKVVF